MDLASDDAALRKAPVKFLTVKKPHKGQTYSNTIIAITASEFFDVLYFLKMLGLLNAFYCFLYLVLDGDTFNSFQIPVKTSFEINFQAGPSSV